MLLLILILSDADNEILYTIYTNNKKRLVHVARAYLGDDAEDVVHDMLIALAEKYENKIEELCAKQDYFFVTIVKNRSIDILRKEKRENIVMLEDDESIFIEESKQPEEEAIAKEEIDRLKSYLKWLKPKYREVLEYKYILGYSHQETADILQISSSLVSTRIRRAVKQLYERFEEEGRA